MPRQGEILSVSCALIAVIAREPIRASATMMEDERSETEGT
jgi:hypothetical protein